MRMVLKRDAKVIRLSPGEHWIRAAPAGLCTMRSAQIVGTDAHSNLLRYPGPVPLAQAGGKAGIGKQKEIEYCRSAQERHKGETKMKTALKSVQVRRIAMKRTIVSLVLVAGTLVVGAVPNAQAQQCSNAT